MSTHTGKIGRLPKALRNELGRRMEDGCSGPELAEWLNGLPEVQGVLREKFGGRPINEQNLSAWRLSGHVNWLRRQEAREGLAELIGDSNRLDDALGDWSLGERLGTVVAAEMNVVGMALLCGETDLEKRWERLRELNREVSRLRRDDDRARRAALQQERWDQELRREGVELEAVKRCVEEEGEVRSEELEAGMVGGGVGGEAQEKPDKSGQIKVNQGDEVQGPKSEGQSLGNGDGRGMMVRGIKSEEVRSQELEAGMAGRQKEELRMQNEEGAAETAGKPDNSGQIKVNQGDEVQGPKSEGQSLGNGDGRGIESEEVRSQGLEAGMAGMAGRVKDEGRRMNGESPERQKEELRMMNLEQLGAGNTGAEARAAGSGNSQAGEAVLQLPSRPPRVPDPDPEQEAYIQWWLMNRNIKPFDGELLERLYAAIPKKNIEVRSQELELSEKAMG